ncbi:MAG TPA: hypothetical protein VNG31_01085 [Candidatus Baltobacteraceae bacterium]|nr:hypothetical protein [Candidatus Baltobacteraceae bacterium]
MSRSFRGGLSALTMSIVALLPAATVAAPLSAASRVGPPGIGPIHFGMTPAQAAATGATLTMLSGAPVPSGETGCYFVRAKGLNDVEFMVEGGTLRRADVDSREIRTTDGFRVGDAAAAIERFYGSRASVNPDKYDPAVQEIEVVPTGPSAAKYRMIFRIKKGAVFQIRAGALPQVQYVERCG